MNPLWHSDHYLFLEAVPGASRANALEEARALARRLECGIVFRFNDRWYVVGKDGKAKFFEDEQAKPVEEEYGPRVQ